MKKLVVLLSLVLALALAAPAFAAVTPQFTLDGEANFGLMYAQNPDAPDAGYRFTGNVTPLRVTLKLSAVDAGDNPKAKFSFETVIERKEENKLQDGKDPNFGDGAFAIGKGNFGLGVSNVVFTFNGAYWKNGPEVTTRVGKLDAWKSEYVSGENKADDAQATLVNAKSATGDGIDLAGMTVGPFDAYFAYLFNGPDRLAVSSFNGELEVVDVSFNTASHYDGNTLVHDFHLGLGLNPADGLSVEANYATDGLNKGYVYDVTGILDTLPGVDVEVGVRGIDPDANWNPRFARRNKDNGACKDNDGDLCAHDSRNGYHVDLSTNQAGIDLGLNYNVGNHPVDDSKNKTVTKFTAATNVNDFALSGGVTLTDRVNDGDDTTKFEASVGKKINNINAKYSFSTEKKKSASEPTVIHTVTADTTVDTPFADAVKLSGQVKIDSSKLDGNAQIHTSAEWTAPNGLKLGLHYANYNRKDHGPIPNAGEPDSNKPLKAEGFYMTAEYGIKF